MRFLKVRSLWTIYLISARSSFLVPEDIEARLSHGSRERYDSQYRHFRHLHCDNPSLQRLIDLINKYHRCYDQEGYITYNKITINGDT